MYPAHENLDAVCGGSIGNNTIATGTGFLCADNTLIDNLMRAITSKSPAYILSNANLPGR